MTLSKLSRKLAAVIAASLVTTAVIAEDMTLPSPSSDCLSRALAQLSIDTANCAGRYPVSSQLYGECLTGAHQAYAGAIRWCVYVSGGKVGALRGSELTKGNGVPLKRR
jgi:hypothetical protein